MEDLIQKAKDLTYPYYKNEKTDDVYYVTKDGWSDNSNNYCSNCIDDAVKEHRKYYLLDQRKKRINPNKDDNRFNIWRDNEFPKFDYSYESYREDNSFCFCEACDKRLKVCLLLDEQELDHWKTATFEKNDYYGYELYTILDDYEYFNFHESKSSDIKTKRKEKLKRINFYLDIENLAKRVIEVFKD